MGGSSADLVPAGCERATESFHIPQRVSFATKNHPYEINGLRVAQISLIIAA